MALGTASPAQVPQLPQLPSHALLVSLETRIWPHHPPLSPKSPKDKTPNPSPATISFRNPDIGLLFGPQAEAEPLAQREEKIHGPRSNPFLGGLRLKKCTVGVAFCALIDNKARHEIFTQGHSLILNI